MSATVVTFVDSIPAIYEQYLGICQGSPQRGEIEDRDANRLDEATDKAAEAVTARFDPSAIKGRMRAFVITAQHP
jgi:hypothetical protein